ncbi:MAG: hypothetical protein HYX92_03835 [Chloroflexi bacterium]|nr:hypothetical protein [Chloroflexota bacterium]
MESWLLPWRSVFQLFTLRSWLIAAAASTVALVLIGIASAIIDNPFFVRTTVVRTQDYVILALTGLLTGLIAGTFTLSAKADASGRAISGGLLSFLAVGCPVCNKLVLLLLGFSGAVTFFAPLQLYIGIASLALLAWALHLRVQAINRGCCTTPYEGEPQKVIWDNALQVSEEERKD